jgi:hypothetical protein
MGQCNPYHGIPVVVATDSPQPKGRSLLVSKRFGDLRQRLKWVQRLQCQRSFA